MHRLSDLDGNPLVGHFYASQVSLSLPLSLSLLILILFQFKVVDKPTEDDKKLHKISKVVATRIDPVTKESWSKIRWQGYKASGLRFFVLAFELDM